MSAPQPPWMTVLLYLVLFAFAPTAEAAARPFDVIAAARRRLSDFFDTPLGEMQEAAQYQIHPLISTRGGTPSPTVSWASVRKAQVLNPQTPHTADGKRKDLHETEESTTYCSHVYCVHSREGSPESMKYGNAKVTRVHHSSDEKYGVRHICRHGMHKENKCGCECFDEAVDLDFIPGVGSQLTEGAKHTKQYQLGFSKYPTAAPTAVPTPSPTAYPTPAPTNYPTAHPCDDGSHS